MSAEPTLVSEVTSGKRAARREKSYDKTATKVDGRSKFKGRDGLEWQGDGRDCNRGGRERGSRDKCGKSKVGA